MGKRTQIVCMHEGKKDSVDPVFINSFLKEYKPRWLRPYENTKLRLVPCGGKTELLNKFPNELQLVHAQGSDTTLVVFADIDDDIETGDELKKRYEEKMNTCNIPKEWLNEVVFIFSKDRIENWIEYILEGKTNENIEGKRVDRSAAKKAAQELAKLCKGGKPQTMLPPSLQWSCKNWHNLVNTMLGN